MIEAQVMDEVVHQYATFRLADEIYGIDVMQVQEVLRYSEITPVPGAPHFVLGIINLRGNVVTVLSTRDRFGLDQEEITDHSRIMIIEAVDQVLGLLVDSVADVVLVKQSEIEKTPNVGNAETVKFISGVCNRNGELLILIELDNMIESGVADEYEII